MGKDEKFHVTLSEPPSRLSVDVDRSFPRQDEIRFSILPDDNVITFVSKEKVRTGGVGLVGGMGTIMLLGRVSYRAPPIVDLLTDSPKFAVRRRSLARFWPSKDSPRSNKD